MNLTWRHKAVLIGVLRDQQAIAAQDFHGGDNMPYMQRGNYRLRIRRAQAGYVPVNVEAWLGGPPSNSETVMFHRAQVQLAAMGLIERHSMAGGRRTTHLRLTDAGLRVAEGLLAEECPIDTGEPLDMADLDLSSLVAELNADAQATP
ncbi:MAG: hypothetical protein ACE15C_18870 [Phycisphaerae bacterium]